MTTGKLSKPHSSTIDNLPDSALDNILANLSLDPRSISVIVLVCKRWLAAAERSAVLPHRTLVPAVLEEVVTAGQQEPFMRFLTRKSRWVLPRLGIYTGDSHIFNELIGPALRVLGAGGGLKHLECMFQGGIPRDLRAITSLTSLGLYSNPDPTNANECASWPATQSASLATLSFLTNLRALDISVHALTEPFIPPEALSCLMHLTSLRVGLWGAAAHNGGQQAIALSGTHLAPLTAMRQLDIIHMGLALPAQQALSSWGNLQQLELLDSQTITTEQGKGAQQDGGQQGPNSFWQILHRLHGLTRVAVRGPDPPNSSHLVRQGLSGCSVLQDLHLEAYTQPALPSPLPALTSLYVGGGGLEALPEGSALLELRCLTLFHTQHMAQAPLSLSQLTQLTSLELAGIGLQVLRALPVLSRLHVREIPPYQVAIPMQPGWDAPISPQMLEILLPHVEVMD
ncbi:hypothetical protein N2152v2_003412 [Parachlorella kessleri]